MPNLIRNCKRIVLGSNFLTVEDSSQPAAVQQFSAIEELFQQTIALGGTISGEHGVGITRAPYIGMEIGSEELALMKRIKTAFDPNGILNPGKIF